MPCCLLFRSYDRSSRSLDQESPSRKKKFQTNYASTTHLLAGKKVPSSLQTKSGDLETTVFYIPGVDVKVKKHGGKLGDVSFFLETKVIKYNHSCCFYPLTPKLSGAASVMLTITHMQ